MGVSLRYLFVTVVSIFIALGVGILVGGATGDQVLADYQRGIIERLENAYNRSLSDKRSLESQLADSRSEMEAMERILASTWSELSGGVLEGAPVSAVILGESFPRRSLEEALSKFGAKTGPRITLQAGFLDLLAAHRLEFQPWIGSPPAGSAGSSQGRSGSEVGGGGVVGGEVEDGEEAVETGSDGPGGSEVSGVAPVSGDQREVLGIPRVPQEVEAAEALTLMTGVLLGTPVPPDLSAKVQEWKVGQFEGYGALRPSAVILAVGDPDEKQARNRRWFLAMAEALREGGVPVLAAVPSGRGSMLAKDFAALGLPVAAVPSTVWGEIEFLSVLQSAVGAGAGPGPAGRAWSMTGKAETGNPIPGTTEKNQPDPMLDYLKELIRKYRKGCADGEGSGEPDIRRLP
ncbi:MAG: copper transporter [Firmicutes bacterium]|nr:copper transporter [Bacillota bacterium]